MGMLDRYKKGNAIMDLVKLVEDSAEPKRTQLMNMVKAEDAEFAARVEVRVLSWEKIRVLPEGIFAEIVGATAPKFIAMVMLSEEAAFVTMVEKCLGKNFNDYKQEKENFKTSPPTPSQVESARRKMVAEARKLDSEGKIKIVSDGAASPPSASADAASPANSNTSAGAQKQVPVSQVLYGGGASGSARAEDQCPPLETFRAEPPPPGLSGERLETYLKSVLGF